MTDINKNAVESLTPHTGPSGNLNRDWVTHNILPATVAADTIFLYRLPHSAKVSGVRTLYGGSGALEIGYQNATTVDTVYFSVSAPGGSTSAADPIRFDEPTYIVATAGAPFTGQIDLLVDYEYVGIK